MREIGRIKVKPNKAAIQQRIAARQASIHALSTCTGDGGDCQDTFVGCCNCCVDGPINPCCDCPLPDVVHVVVSSPACSYWDGIEVDLEFDPDTGRPNRWTWGEAFYNENIEGMDFRSIDFYCSTAPEPQFNCKWIMEIDCGGAGAGQILTPENCTDAQLFDNLRVAGSGCCEVYEPPGFIAIVQITVTFIYS